MIAWVENGNSPQWPLVRLGDVARTSSGGTPSRAVARYYKGNIPWAKIEDITRAGMWISETEEQITDAAIQETGVRVFPPRSVLFAMYASIGATAITTIPMSCNQAIIACECLPELDPEFLYHWFCGSRDALFRRGRGGTQANLNAAIVNDLRIPLPPLTEQKRIAGQLRDQIAAVDKVRAASSARLKAIQDLQLACYREAFGESPALAASSGKPVEPTQMGWKWYRLTELARLATGHTPSRYHPEFWRGAILWLQLADIRALDGQVVQDTSEHTNELGIANSAAVLLPQGTVCMSRTASVGFVAIAGRPLATSQDFVNWVCGPELDPWFLMHLLIASRNTVLPLGSGAVHHTIYFPTVEAFSVCVPSLQEQQRIAESLRNQMASIEKANAAADEELLHINALPAAVLRHALPGHF